MNTDHLFGNLTVSISVFWGFFSQVRTEKVSVGCFKRLISLFISVSLSSLQGVHLCLQIGAVELPPRTSEHRLFRGVASLPLTNRSCPTPAWSCL